MPSFWRPNSQSSSSANNANPYQRPQASAQAPHQQSSPLQVSEQAPTASSLLSTSTPANWANRGRNTPNGGYIGDRFGPDRAGGLPPGSQGDPNALSSGSGGDTASSEAAPYSPTDQSGTPDIDELREAWADMMKTSEEGFENTLYGIDADESRAARRAAEMNASMGGSVGGNFQGGQIQAQLSGTVARAQAAAQHRMEQLQTKGAMLEMWMEAAEAQSDREFQEELTGLIHENNLELAEAQHGYNMALQSAGLEGEEDEEDVEGIGDGYIWGNETADEINNPDHPNYQSFDQYSASDWIKKIIGDGGGFGKDENQILSELNSYLQTLMAQGIETAELENVARYMLHGYYTSGGTWPSIAWNSGPKGKPWGDDTLAPTSTGPSDW